MVKNKWLTYSPLLLILILSRFLFLGDKAYHHDESLYATYSLKVAHHLDYQFDPMLHGPTLYFFQGLFFLIFGVSDFSGRITSALTGIIAIVVIAMLLKNRSSKSSVLWMCFAMTSPILTYFSRFIGMDILMCATFAGMVYVAQQYWTKQQTFWVPTLFALTGFLVCTKLNFLFYLFIVITFFIFAYWLSERRIHIHSELLQRIKAQKWIYLLGLSLFMLIFCFLYSGAFKHPEGIANGLYRKMLPYWIGQHKIERIGGAFFYYIPIFTTYEWPLVALFFAGLVTFFRLHIARALALIGICVLIFLVFKNSLALSGFVDKAFHMHNPWDFPASLFILTIAAFHFKRHLKQNDTWSAFALYWFALSFFMYSYAGEKVPWLTTHVVFAGYFYLANLADKTILNKKILAFMILLLSWQSFNVIRSTFMTLSDPKELLVYTHTDQGISALSKKIDQLAKQSHLDKSMLIQVPDKTSAVWPMAWYFRNYTSWFVSQINAEANPAIVFYDWHLKHEVPQKISTYYQERHKLRVWWVPDLTKQTFMNTIRYILFHEPFSELGSIDIQIFIRPDLVQYWPKES